ncbi:MAG: PD40 domain-containing protein, partial [Rhizobacter sp.]|nr:PD40 domain-containing protein [Chlorobiales bacterium]
MSVPATHGYYRYPTLCKDSLIFTCEDDLWHVPVSGGTARRITSGLAECAFPALSPDGSLVAFTGREDGQPEVYVMPTEGGHPKRLTYLGGQITRVLGWHDGRIIFTTNARQAFLKFQELHAVSPDGGGEPVSLGLGHGMSISFGHGNRAVIGRNSADAARWKRYKGGTAGDIWIDASGHGQFSRLNQAMNLRGNLISPIWMTTKQGDRIYFVSDHEGVANFYSVSPEGTALRRHTHHSDYFVRYPQPDAAGDGKIVYHAGADLYTLDTATDTVTKVDVAFHSPQTQRGRKFVSASQFLEDYFLHPEGHSLALTSRGKFFTAAVNEGPATQFGTPFHQGHAVRYRLAQYLHDGERVAVLSDASGEEALEIYGEHNRAEHQFDKLDVGRAILMLASPKTNHVLITNHRQEVLLVDVDKGTLKQIDHSSARRIESAAWSPDGRYIAYPLPLSNEKAAMKIYDVEAGVAHTVTEPLLTDFAPSFTPDGNYLCLLSQRVFDPVYDNLHFDLNFPKGTKPYLLPLRSRLASPFLLSPKPPAKSPVKPDGNGLKPNDMKANDDGTHAAETAPNDVPGETKYEIEFDGILQRLVEFPVVEGRYEQLAAGHTKIFFSHFPIEGAMKLGRSTARTDGTLSAFNFAEKKTEVIAEGITDFKLSADARTLAYRAGEKLVVVSADEPSVPAMFAAMKPPEKPFDFSRLKLAVEPVAEWQQMYREAWRLQRDQFWTPDMSGVDWPQVYERYLPLISRVASRSEFSDVMWEMQGELGTSHCYEQGGDYRPEPKYFQGLLGAEINFDVVKNTYRITSIVRG